VLKHRYTSYETSNEPITDIYITTSKNEHTVEVPMKANDIKRSTRPETYASYSRDDLHHTQNGKVSETASHVQNPDSINQKHILIKIARYIFIIKMIIYLLQL